jgi:streptogramin lyase
MQLGAKSMKSLHFGRYPLSSLAVAASLAGCAGSQPPISAASAAALPQVVLQFSQYVKGGGSWAMYTDTGYLQGIVRLQQDYWVANGYMSNALSRFTPKGKLTTFEIGYSPLEMVSDGRGNLWFDVATSLQTIVRFNMQSSKLAAFTLTDDTAGGIMLGKDGNIWFVEVQHVGKLTPAGKLTEYPTPQTEGGSGIAWGEDGLVWFVTYSATDRAYVLTSLNPKTAEVSASNAVATSSGLAIVAAPDGSIWHGITGSPMYLARFDPKTKTTRMYRGPVNFSFSPCPGAMTLAADGSIWYASQRLSGTRFDKRVVGGGFVRFDMNAKQFTTYASPKGYGWNCELVTGSNGTVWGTSGGAVTVLRATRE